LKSGAEANSAVEPVTYGCWWRHGIRHCRYYRAPVYGFYARPRFYGYGHYGYRRWW
jgi:hypothetical protein